MNRRLACSDLQERYPLSPRVAPIEFKSLDRVILRTLQAIELVINFYGALDRQDVDASVPVWLMPGIDIYWLPLPSSCVSSYNAILNNSLI